MSPHATEIAQLREEISAIQAATLDGVLGVDPRGRVRSVNRRAAELFGRAEDDLLGADVICLMTAEHANAESAYRHATGTTVLSRAVDQTVDVTCSRPDGEKFPCRLSVRKVGHGPDCTYLCVVHDLSGVRHSARRIIALHEQTRSRSDDFERVVEQRTSQLQQTIEDLAVANQQLEREIAERESIARDLQRREVQLEQLLRRERELGELRSRLVSMASHEFRTPLTTMLSSVEVIEMSVEEMPPLMSKHTARIRESIGYLRNVLEDFLQVGKLDARGTDLQVAECDIRAQVTALIEDLSLMCKPGQDIELTIAGNVEPAMHSANALRIIVTNLVTNAIKYSEPGTAIDVRLSDGDGTLEITVSDEGIGIPESDLPLLFERFFRAKNAVTITGTGLGLNIVAKYVAAMDGQIRAESPGEGGAKFTVTLPYPLPAPADA